MGKTIRIAELSRKEVDKILRTKKFNRLAPVCCNACGYKGFFKRRIFKIDGDYDLGDDEGQNVVRYLSLSNTFINNFLTLRDTKDSQSILELSDSD